tara:strand:- start:5068 stop:5754 length:687 start_codon:yes stop_codon:yes gene_type:complete
VRYLEVSKKDHLAYVSMDHEHKNAFNTALVQECLDMLHTLAEDEETRVVIWSGRHPKYFCTGLDVPWALEQEDDALEQFFTLSHQLLHTIFMYPKPTIAHLNGHAFGLGAIMSCAFDFRFMNAHRGWICFPGVDIGKMGVSVPSSMHKLVAFTMPTHHLHYALLTGARMTGQEAQSKGLVHQALPPKELEGAIETLANTLKEKDQASYFRVKQDLRGELAHILQHPSR